MLQEILRKIKACNLKENENIILVQFFIGYL